MILREKICQEIYEAYQSGIDHNQVPFKYPPMGDPEIRESADAAIQAMRDALLSEAAVEAAAKGLWDAESDGNPVREWQGGVTDAHPGMARYYRDQASAALTAAIAAVGTEGSE